MLWRYRLPFLVMPIAVTLWYFSMDLSPFLFRYTHMIWEFRVFISLGFGMLIVLLAFWVDIRTRHDKDYAFWLYVFGVIYLGIIWQRHEEMLSSKLRDMLPRPVRELIDKTL